MKRAFPILVFLVVAFLGYAAYQALVVAPTEQTMGDVQRIFYYHVPSAWTAFLLFFFNFIASIQYLTEGKPARRAVNWSVIAIGIIGAIAPFIPQVKQQLPVGMYPSSVATTALAIAGLYFLIGKLFSGQALDALAVTTAEVGVVFCTIVLVTGPIWARPVWGIWWTWDMRLTTTLIMWLLYVSYLLLRRSSEPGSTSTLATVFALSAAVDIPIVWMAIRWIDVHTQHPQPVF